MPLRERRLLQGKLPFSVCSALIQRNPTVPKARQKTNYMVVEQLVFPGGQPTATVHGHITSNSYSENKPYNVTKSI